MTNKPDKDALRQQAVDEAQRVSAELSAARSALLDIARLAQAAAEYEEAKKRWANEATKEGWDMTKPIYGDIADWRLRGVVKNCLGDECHRLEYRETLVAHVTVPLMVHASKYNSHAVAIDPEAQDIVTAAWKEILNILNRKRDEVVEMERIERDRHEAAEEAAKQKEFDTARSAMSDLLKGDQA